MTSRAGPATSRERLIAVPWRNLPISPEWEISFSGTGCTLLHSSEANALRAFSRLRLHEPTDPTVAALRERHLLVGEAQLLHGLRSSGPALAPCAIETAGILTHNRPAHLAACVGSLLAAAEAAGRRLEIVVVDDSESPGVREENLLQLKRLSTRAEIRYCGPGERTAYCRRLMERGVARHACEYATRPRPRGNGFGAARNVLLLDQAGAAFLSADDDTVAHSAVHPAVNRALRLVGHGPGFDYWFFRDRADAVAWARWEQLDIIGEHEALLGRSVATLLARGQNPIDLDMVCGHFAEPGWNPHIVGTMPGKVGDSGRIDPDWDIWIGNWTADRATCGRLEVVELPPSPTVIHDACLMTTMFALDARRILPPFLPQHSIEDGAFACLLSRVIPNACWGIVPHAILHDRPTRGVEPPPTFLTTTQMFMALIAGLPPRQNGQNVGAAIQAAGTAFSRIASDGAREFRQVTIEHTGRYLAAPLRSLRQQSEGGREHDFRERLAAIHERLVSEFERICRPAPGWDWRGLQQQVADYGHLLQHWPAIFDAARELRAAGVRPSLRLETFH